MELIIGTLILLLCAKGLFNLITDRKSKFLKVLYKELEQPSRQASANMVFSPSPWLLFRRFLWLSIAMMVIILMSNNDGMAMIGITFTLGIPVLIRLISRLAHLLDRLVVFRDEINTRNFRTNQTISIEKVTRIEVLISEYRSLIMPALIFSGPEYIRMVKLFGDFYLESLPEIISWMKSEYPEKEIEVIWKVLKNDTESRIVINGGNSAVPPPSPVSAG